MYWLAEGTSSAVNVGGDWGLVVTIAQTGVVGIVLICILTGKLLVPVYLANRERKALETQLADQQADYDKRMVDLQALLDKGTADQKAYYESRINDLKNSHAAEIINRDTTIIEEKAKNERYSRLIEDRVVPTLVQANQLAANYAEDMRRAGHGS